MDDGAKMRRVLMQICQGLFITAVAVAIMAGWVMLTPQ